MTPLPPSDDSLVIRTSFSDDAAWSAIRSEIAQPVDIFRANVTFIDDRRYDGLTIAKLLELEPDAANRTFVFLVDTETVAHPEHPVLVVDLYDQRGRTFRV